MRYIFHYPEPSGPDADLFAAGPMTDVAVAAEQATDAKRKEAESARAEAQAKEAEANAVIKFFEGYVFAAGRPKGQEGGRGSTVSLRDAIVASLPALSKVFADRPLVEARLRLTLGSTFFYLGEPQHAAEQIENRASRGVGERFPYLIEVFGHGRLRNKGSGFRLGRRRSRVIFRRRL